MKVRLLVSEVRPLNRTQERRVSWSQDTTHKQNQDQSPSLQDQIPEQNRTSRDQTQPPQAGNQNQQGQVEDTESSSAQEAQRPAPLKKKVQTAVESRRNQGPVARATASLLSSSSGLRKTQSVQSLLTDTGTTQNQRLRSSVERNPDCRYWISLGTYA